MDARWNNRDPFQRNTFEVRNLCPEYGTVIAKVDLDGAMDRTLHLDDGGRRTGSSLHRIGWIYCCSDVGGLCNRRDMDTDAGCLARFERMSSAAQTCVHATASATPVGGVRSCTVTAHCERIAHHVPGQLPWVYSSITVPWTDLDDVANCDGTLTLGSCSSRQTAPPGLSVADARVREGPGASLVFRGTLGAAAAAAVTVDYATSDGTATAGSDYRATRGTLALAPGETEKTVSVTMLDDRHDEGIETLTLMLSNPRGVRIADPAATGTIVDVDPLSRAWIAGFGRALASGLVDRLGERLTAGDQDLHLTLGGQRIGPAPVPAAGEAWPAPEMADTAGEQWRHGIAGGPDRYGHGVGDDGGVHRPSQGMSGRGLLSYSAFLLADGDAVSSTGRRSVWGGTAPLQFGVGDGAVGEGLTGLIGADVERGRLRAGVALSHGAGRGGHGPGGNAGNDASVNGVHPYLRLALSDRFSVWSALGYGAGEMSWNGGDVHDGRQPRRHAHIGMWMAALGAGGALLTPEDGSRAVSRRGLAETKSMASTSSSCAGAPACAGPGTTPCMGWSTAVRPR